MPKSPRPRAVAYIRVSKVGDRGDDLKSPEYQLMQIQDYARRNGYDVVATVEDRNKSGRDFSKRRIAEIVTRLKAGEFEKVLVWKWSRWGRNLMQNLMWLAQVEEAGGEVESATEPVDTNTSSGEFNRTMFLAMADLQSKQIGDGWKETQKYRRLGGLPHTSAPRFGYVYNKERKPYPRYEIVEEQAAILRDAYQRYVKGTATFRSLSIEWNRRGITNIAGRHWIDASVRVMMDTGFAAGLIRERTKQPKPGQPNSRRLAAFDEWREGSHQPAIDRELWDAYHAKRMKGIVTAPALRQPKHTLSGMLFCHLCGQTLKAHVSGDRGQFRQWNCREGRDHRHTPVSISDKKAMRAVMAWLNEQAVGGEDVTVQAQLIVDQRAHTNRELDWLKSCREKAARKRKRLQELWLDGDFDRDFYETQKAALDEELASVELLMEKATARDRLIANRPSVESFQVLAEAFADWLPQHQRSALDEILLGIIVLPGRELDLVPAFT